MPICPVDLSHCHRRECASGICDQCNDIALLPCGDCGTLIALGGICGDCYIVELSVSKKMIEVKV